MTAGKAGTSEQPSCFCSFYPPSLHPHSPPPMPSHWGPPGHCTEEPPEEKFCAQLPHSGSGGGVLRPLQGLLLRIEQRPVSLRRRQLGAQKGGRLRRLAGANKFRMWKKSFLGCPSKEGSNVPECGESRRGERAGGGGQEGAIRIVKLTPSAGLPRHWACNK